MLLKPGHILNTVLYVCFLAPGGGQGHTGQPPLCSVILCSLPLYGPRHPLLDQITPLLWWDTHGGVHQVIVLSHFLTQSRGEFHWTPSTFQTKSVLGSGSPSTPASPHGFLAFHCIIFWISNFVFLQDWQVHFSRLLCALMCSHVYSSFCLESFPIFASWQEQFVYKDLLVSPPLGSLPGALQQD